MRPGALGAALVRPGAPVHRKGGVSAAGRTNARVVRPGALGAPKVRPGALGAPKVRPVALGRAVVRPTVPGALQRGHAGGLRAHSRERQ